MPTYEYRCPDGHEFTRFYKTISAGVSELPCPDCGKMAERQLSSGGGLVFKGSGFYLTDYGKNAHRGGAPPKSDPAKSEGGKAEGGKAEGGKADAAASTSAKGDSKTESPKPSAESSKPKAESKPAPKAKPE